MVNNILAALIASWVLTATVAPGPAVAADEPVAVSGPMEPDAWYPRVRTSPKGQIVVNAPQLDDWENFSVLSGWVAFQVTPTGSKTSPYGSLNFRGKTKVDLETREVLIYEPEILSLNIPNVPESDVSYTLVRDALTAQPTTVPLDLVLEYLPADAKIPATAGLNSKPPRIVIATTPSILLNIDAKPQWVPIKDTELEFVLNSNWDVFRRQGEQTSYLRYQQNWLTGPGLEGEWSWASELPKNLGKLPADANWNEVRPAVPADTTNISAPASPAPQVVYATSPTELIQFDGEPDWQPLGTEGIEFGANTRQEVLRLDAKIYLLLSGRWFTAASFAGPWTWTTKLPAAFTNLPTDGDKAYLRASVPGTSEARNAAVVKTIPRTITVSRDAANLAPKVTYAGEPVFETIAGTQIKLALNTSFQVLQYQDKWYLCNQAMWFKSGSPVGPWELADALPAPFSQIPPASPAYNTTFVKIDSADADSVTFSYTSGYENVYVVADSVVQGTGFHAPVTSTWVVYGSGYYNYPYYPYYPYPPTYGYGSWYNPDTGRYGESVVAYGPYGAARSTAVYNPSTGVYARGQAVWDSNEYAGRDYAYNPNTNTSTAGNRYANFDDKEGWSQRVVTRGDEWLYKESEWDDGRMVTDFETSRGTEGEVVRERDGDTIKSEGTITGENRSAEFQSEWEDGQGKIDVQGSGGATGEFSREIEDGQMTGSGTITKDGKTIETDTRRTAEGVQRDFETSEGGQGTVVRQGDERAFVAESSGGDVYAGRDGEVYKKTDDGWSQVENPAPDSQAQASRQRAQDAERERAAADRERTRSENSYDRNGLDRDYGNRSQGYQRYGNHQRARQQRSFGGRGGGRRRR